MNTTLLLIDYGPKLGSSFPETVDGFTLDDAVSDILSGAQHGSLRAVYEVREGERTKDVSEIVADKIAAAWIAGQFVSPMAREFVDYCGREVREAAE
ncbi:MAG: hypothetical protein WC026_16765 [Hyphomicrobium sp.]|uniref:hypothetical protein n=1 Tax=Hyphomicrobium sp. TaxID=82 RepID=UPI00356422D8